jgi:hypothetical protein
MASFWLDELTVDFCYNRIFGVLKTFLRFVRIFMLEKDKCNRKWRKLHGGEHHNKYFSPNLTEKSPSQKLIVA